MTGKIGFIKHMRIFTEIKSMLRMAKQKAILVAKKYNQVSSEMTVTYTQRTAGTWVTALGDF